MIHSIPLDQRRDMGGYLIDMHRLRHDIYAEERGWTGLHSPFGLDIDEYDSPLAHYLLAMDHERVVGSVRFMPSQYNTLLRDRFSHTLVLDCPEGDTVWEIGRFNVSQAARRGPNVISPVRQLSLAMLDYALEAGVDTFVGIFDTWLLPVVARFPWKIEHLGMPTEYEEGECIPLALRFDHARVAAAKAKTGFAGTFLVHGLGDLSPRPCKFVAEDWFMIADIAKKHEPTNKLCSGFLADLSSGDATRVFTAEQSVDVIVTDLFARGGRAVRPKSQDAGVTAKGNRKTA